MRNEIKPSLEARQLIVNLESRLDRRTLEDSLAATKHFLIRVKSPNSELRHQNEFDFSGQYRKLPPQERDFVHQQAVRQIEYLESSQHIFSQSMANPASIVKNGNNLDVLREKIASEIVVMLHDQSNVDSAIIAKQTKMIQASYADWNQKSKAEIKDFISKVSSDFAERIDKQRSSPSDRVTSSDQFNQRSSKELNWEPGRESGRRMVQSRG